MSTKEMVKVLMHVSFWGIGFSIIYLTMSHSDVREAYGFITGWWCACYLGYVTNIKSKAVIPSYLLYVTLCIVSFSLGDVWFYHGAGSNLNIQLVVIILLQGVVFVSPILINELTRWVSGKLNFA